MIRFDIKKIPMFYIMSLPSKILMASSRLFYSMIFSFLLFFFSRLNQNVSKCYSDENKRLAKKIKKHDIVVSSSKIFDKEGFG